MGQAVVAALVTFFATVGESVIVRTILINVALMALAFEHEGVQYESMGSRNG